MLYNHRKQTVYKHDGTDSLCPECRAQLTARRGDKRVWHWAHKRKETSRISCEWEESSWHLRWKLAYSEIAGWNVEHRVEIFGKRYVLDAFDPIGQNVKEFVHSLSPKYADKHATLIRRYRNCVVWIYDGEEFGSSRKKWVGNGGVKNLLKPRAKESHEATGGYVHIAEGEFKGVWQHWKGNIWYPYGKSDVFVAAFGKAAEYA